MSMVRQSFFSWNFFYYIIPQFKKYQILSYKDSDFYLIFYLKIKQQGKFLIKLFYSIIIIQF